MEAIQKVESWISAGASTTSAKVAINGWMYSLNINHVPEADRERTLLAFQGQVEEAYKRGHSSGAKEALYGVKAALGG